MELASTQQQGYGPARERFISKTFNHLGAALLAFVAIEVILFKSGVAEGIAKTMLGLPWLLIIGAFTLLGWLASRTAHTVESLPVQYAALGAYIFLESIFFVPMFYIADKFAPGAIANAGLITVLGTIGLVAIVYTSRKDFSFLGAILKWGGLLALALIVCSAIFGFKLGIFFDVVMIGFAGAAILYDTSNVIHHYPEDRYVGAALELFASVALMLWYVLRLLISLRD
ncbi:Bax inhibitor-1/YccA family protein [Undibacterium sp. TJN19]|uniref:Bax inhibitor-1/YccA family protein n=1 Tax=Undibacterium sp. TJN19 TaxID=3413055 RepID=UPI003BF2B6BB